MARPQKAQLGELLVRQGLLSAEQLKQALQEQRKSGGRLGRIIVDRAYVTEDQIAEALARQLGVPYIDLKYFSVSPEVAAKLPEAAARRYRALMLEAKDGAVRVGMSDPTDLGAYDEIARILRRDIDLAVVSESELLRAIDRLYGKTEEITGLAHELQAELGEPVVDFGALAITPELEEAPVVRLLQAVFQAALRARASDIHIEPQELRLQIRFRIDGVLHIQSEVDRKIAAALALRLKLMSRLNISEKRLPQDGRFSVKVGNSHVDVRISTMPTYYGESIAMRLLTRGGGILSLDRIGMPDRILQRVREVIDRPRGMILVTGPTGSGKTTTLYAALSQLNTPARKIITVEDPVEYRLPGINQVQVNEKIDLTFDRVLRAALRQDPDVILVGEMRDIATVNTGLRAAITGHMVLSTLHTSDAVSTPIRLLDIGAPRYMVALSLHLVVAQRLVRLVCEGCAAAFKPSSAEEEWAASERGPDAPAAQYRRGRGCSQCNGTGYLGRTGVYEMLEMTRDVVEAANQPDATLFAHAARRQMAGHTLQRHAAELASQGRTTIEEAVHVTSGAED
ncbi:MAG TPA: GspE/PulE family protein [Burkholderiales bacterium]|nr:GspE/PulE family protein [Burkholderiales bacterium]